MDVNVNHTRRAPDFQPLSRRMPYVEKRGRMGDLARERFLEESPRLSNCTRISILKIRWLRTAAAPFPINYSDIVRGQTAITDGRSTLWCSIDEEEGRVAQAIRINFVRVADHVYPSICIR